ncbi:hypothetical protein CONCODRAFT_7325 [Conidiobolus coronatus NRRL 28638]|uniref:Uncharacterized protein n=1 Tax=Conidiobolus coronatus (strain ATCC 28846 / CBS 209.66 / NRRL 28638) TaxID=796925 RepID=A0A137P587_CONC2|nr:hypothetical protein CONCODRAFT_7325 [Conidiobolus coronatus NRRL 28638]|eukprot:KXN70180.1 hypothetical protein CONCODRAFT_7325 [Conidiobolus coronatus NRRL 28638]
MYGIHTNANYMHEPLNLDRKFLFHQISFYDLTSSGTFNLKPRYIAELPEFNSRLNKVSNYLAPKDLLETEHQSYDLNILNAKLSSVNSICDSITAELIHFDFITSTDDATLENTCITRFNLFERNYTKTINSLNQLKREYSRYVKKIENFEYSTQASQLHVGLLILEYGRINQACLSDTLLIPFVLALMTILTECIGLMSSKYFVTMALRLFTLL